MNIEEGKVLPSIKENCYVGQDINDIYVSLVNDEKESEYSYKINENWCLQLFSKDHKPIKRSAPPSSNDLSNQTKGSSNLTVSFTNLSQGINSNNNNFSNKQSPGVLPDTKNLFSQTNQPKGLGNSTSTTDQKATSNLFLNNTTDNKQSSGFSFDTKNMFSQTNQSKGFGISTSTTDNKQSPGFSFDTKNMFNQTNQSKGLGISTSTTDNKQSPGFSFDTKNMFNQTNQSKGLGISTSTTDNKQSSGFSFDTKNMFNQTNQPKGLGNSTSTTDQKATPNLFLNNTTDNKQSPGFSFDTKNMFNQTNQLKGLGISTSTTDNKQSPGFSFDTKNMFNQTNQSKGFGISTSTTDNKQSPGFSFDTKNMFNQTNQSKGLGISTSTTDNKQSPGFSFDTKNMFNQTNQSKGLGISTSTTDNKQSPGFSFDTKNMFNQTNQSKGVDNSTSTTDNKQSSGFSFDTKNMFNQTNQPKGLGNSTSTTDQKATPNLFLNNTTDNKQSPGFSFDTKNMFNQTNQSKGVDNSTSITDQTTTSNITVNKQSGLSFGPANQSTGITTNHFNHLFNNNKKEGTDTPNTSNLSNQLAKTAVNNNRTTFLNSNIQQSKKNTIKIIGKLESDGTILFNCDKTKFLIFVDGLIQIYELVHDSKSQNEDGIAGIKIICDIAEYLTPRKETSKGDTQNMEKQNNEIHIKSIKWSPYSPDVFALLTPREIKICQLDLSSKSTNQAPITIKNKYDLNLTKSDVINEFYAFTWGDSSNIWLKYSIMYSTNKKSSIFLMRPAIPSGFVLPFKDYIKMTSTLDSKLSSKFSNTFISAKGASRVFMHTPNHDLITEIPVKSIENEICALHWVNSYLDSYLILIDSKSIIYIVSIHEVDDFIKDFSNSSKLTFLSPKNLKFRDCQVLEKIDIYTEKTFINDSVLNFSVSNGIFLNTSRQIYRLFLKKRNLSNESVNDLNNCSINSKNKEIYSDENSVLKLFNLDEEDKNKIYKLALLAEFDDIKGACGNGLLTKEIGKLTTIGEYPYSVKKSKLENKDQLDEYLKLFDNTKLIRMFEIVNRETQRLQQIQETIEDEIDLYLDKQYEIEQANSELQQTANMGEQLQRRLQNLLQRKIDKLQENE